MTNWAPGSTACLDDETLERAARGRLKRGERSDVADHLVSCSQCSRAVHALRALSSWARDAEAGVRAARLPRVAPLARRPVVRIVALAAMLMIAAGLAALWQAGGRPTTTTQRGVGQMGMAVEPIDGAVTNVVPVRLAWTPESRDVLYRVAVYDAESTLLWQSELTSGVEVELPSAVRLKLAIPGRYYWRVLGVSGVVERSGPLLRFDVARGSVTP